jgi:hypothetical protein
VGHENVNGGDDHVGDALMLVQPGRVNGTEMIQY